MVEWLTTQLISFVNLFHLSQISTFQFQISSREHLRFIKSTAMWIALLISLWMTIVNAAILLSYTLLHRD